MAGELLSQAEELLKQGLTTTEVADGYVRASEQVLSMLDALVIPGSDKLDLRDAKAVAVRLTCPLSAKQFGFEDVLAPLIAEACIMVCPKNPVNFNVDNVRTIKIPGSTLSSSSVVHGMVIKRNVEGTITRKDNCKVAVYAQVRAPALPVFYACFRAYVAVITAIKRVCRALTRLEQRPRARCS